VVPATVEARLLSFATRRRLIAPDLTELAADTWPLETREAARWTWSRRVAGETRSVEVAVELATAYAESGLELSGMDPAIARLEEDERAHVALCQAFVRGLGSHDVRAGERVADAQPLVPEPDSEPPSVHLLRYVLTGLAVCESVSALRFAVVRAHTDLPLPRACIDLFLRDESAHARLGFVLLPAALAHHRALVGVERAASDIDAELRSTLRHLDLAVGLDAHRRNLTLRARPQPTENPGVIEPALDALAFYRGMERTIVPRLERLGVAAISAWRDRWVTPVA